MSPVQPPGKRARSEVGENITAVIKKDVVDEEEMAPLGTMVRRYF